MDEPAWLYTTSSTRLEWVGRWCAGHGWMPWWLHNPLHRAHLLPMRGPRLSIPPLRLEDDNG